MVECVLEASLYEVEELVNLGLVDDEGGHDGEPARIDPQDDAVLQSRLLECPAQLWERLAARRILYQFNAS